MNDKRKTENQLCRIYVVRHGETEWNVQKRLQGHKDSPLTENGISQAREVAKKFSEINFDGVYASDLLRAKRTAEIISLEREMEVQANELLRERNFGKHEGKSKDEFGSDLEKRIALKDNLEKEQRIKFKLDDDVESDEELMSRVFTFFREIALAHTGKNVLVVAHGGVMRAMLVHLGEHEYQELPSGSISNLAHVVLESDGVEFFVREKEGINEISSV